MTFSISRTPLRGKHPVWYVLLDGQLLCACAYRKGALALIAFLRDPYPCPPKAPDPPSRAFYGICRHPTPFIPAQGQASLSITSDFTADFSKPRFTGI